MIVNLPTTKTEGKRVGVARARVELPAPQEPIRIEDVRFRVVFRVVQHGSGYVNLHCAYGCRDRIGHTSHSTEEA